MLMSVNWKMDETALGHETFAEDFDDYGRGGRPQGFHW